MSESDVCFKHRSAQPPQSCPAHQSLLDPCHGAGTLTSSHSWALPISTHSRVVLQRLRINLELNQSALIKAASGRSHQRSGEMPMVDQSEMPSPTLLPGDCLLRESRLGFNQILRLPPKRSVFRLAATSTYLNPPESPTPRRLELCLCLPSHGSLDAQCCGSHPWLSPNRHRHRLALVGQNCS
jgi:hypothetical protein